MDITLKLNEAIAVLDDATYLNSPQNISFNLSAKAIQFLITTYFSKEKQKNCYPSKKKVDEAIEIIVRNRLFIEQLKSSTKENQDLATSIINTVTAYNLSKKIHVNQTGLSRFISMIQNKEEDYSPTLTLPQKIVTNRYYHDKALPSSISLSFSHTIASSIVIPEQSKELFRMKALSLLEKYGIASNFEARHIVRETPIFACNEKDTLTYTLSQTLNLFPGITIVVMGNSSIDSKTASITKLFPETFRLSLESRQTAFPAPSQRSGFALAHQLIPEQPQRIDLLGKTAHLFKRKDNAIKALLPDSELLKSAKAILSQKKQLFEKNKETLLKLHRELSLAILQASKESVSLSDIEITHQFYDTLNQEKQLYDSLLKANNSLIENFISKPYEQLITSILQGQLLNLKNSDESFKFVKATQILDQSLTESLHFFVEQEALSQVSNEKIKLKYIQLYGPILGSASKNIILQYLSEDLIFSPPILTSFESKIQTGAYTHLENFLSELDLLPRDLFNHMQQHLIDDITLFNSGHPTIISEEIALYFKKRYMSLNSDYAELIHK